MSEISFRLRLVRKLRGYIRSKDFAEEFDLPYSTYSQHEVGSRNMSTRILFEYATKLGIKPAWLLTGMGNPSDSSSSLPIIDKQILSELRLMEKSEKISATELPLFKEEEAISNIDTKLFRLVLEKALSFAKKNEKHIDPVDLSSLIISLYNNIVGLDTEKKELENILNLSLESYFLGCNTGHTKKVSSASS